MNYETLLALDKLREAIESRVYPSDRKSIDAILWQDFDVTICERSNDHINRWCKLPSEYVHEFHRYEPRRRVVATRFGPELAWLFDELRVIHLDEREQLTNHDFYAAIADEANLFIEQHKGGVTAARLLESVLDYVKKLYR